MHDYLRPFTGHPEPHEPVGIAVFPIIEKLAISVTSSFADPLPASSGFDLSAQKEAVAGAQPIWSTVRWVYDVWVYSHNVSTGISSLPGPCGQIEIDFTH